MDLQNSLNNQLLIAMPGLADPNFSTTVTLVCEHNDEGALGIVINRPSNLDLASLFEQLSVEDVVEDIGHTAVLDGGPVARERGFVLHTPSGDFESSVSVSNDIQLTFSRDVLDSIAAGQGPDRTVVALGYAGWQSGQLEEEMLHNAWLTVPATAELIFEVPFEERWARAAETMGIDLKLISPHAGHA
jgi:putative transcriptional regulator